MQSFAWLPERNWTRFQLLMRPRAILVLHTPLYPFFKTASHLKRKIKGALHHLETASPGRKEEGGCQYQLFLGMNLLITCCRGSLLPPPLPRGHNRGAVSQHTTCTLPKPLTPRSQHAPACVCHSLPVGFACLQEIRLGGGDDSSLLGQGETYRTALN